MRNAFVTLASGVIFISGCSHSSSAVPQSMGNAQSHPYRSEGTHTNPPTHFRILHIFQDKPDGALPYAGVIRDAAGNLYGTTFSGGTSYGDVGVVFKLDPSGNETILHDFSGSDGAEPAAPLIEDAAGNFYGTTYAGGSFNYGTAFKLDANLNESVLHNFNCCVQNDGWGPNSGLVRDPVGNLFGTTFGGGSGYDGIAYKLDPTEELTVLHDFSWPDGSLPTGLFQDSAGIMYGATNYGGIRQCRPGCGVVFKLDPSGNEKSLHIFSGLNGTGRNPLGTLVGDAAGNLYGTTYHGGGIKDYGVVYKLAPTGSETVLHKFNGANGAHPKAGLLLDSAGDLFGTTSTGGSFGHGVVFELDASGNYLVLHNFNGTDGSVPEGALIQDPAGDLFGTTLEGGNNGCNRGCGVVFELTP